MPTLGPSTERVVLLKEGAAQHTAHTKNVLSANSKLRSPKHLSVSPRDALMSYSIVLGEFFRRPSYIVAISKK
jgi:hypothetical protein